MEENANNETEPVIEPTPEPVIEPTPEPVIEPTPEPVIEPTPDINIPGVEVTPNTKSLALVRISDGLVDTFLRMDIPIGWTPPEGFVIIPDDKLPEGWQRVPAPIPPVPESVTATQIRLWLVSNGVSLDHVDLLIDRIPDQLLRSQIKVQWEYAPYVERNHPMIKTLGASLGFDDNQIDQAFREASLL